MHFKYKTIAGKKYKYAVKSIRLPDGSIKKIEKIFNGESKKDLEDLFEKKETNLYANYMLRNFKIDHILDKSGFKDI